MEVIRLSQSEQSKSPVELEGKVRKPIATTYSVNYLPLTQTEQRSLTKIKEKTSQTTPHKYWGGQLNNKRNRTVLEEIKKELFSFANQIEYIYNKQNSPEENNLKHKHKIADKLTTNMTFHAMNQKKEKPIQDNFSVELGLGKLSLDENELETYSSDSDSSGYSSQSSRELSPEISESSDEEDVAGYTGYTGVINSLTRKDKGKWGTQRRTLGGFQGIDLDKIIAQGNRKLQYYFILSIFEYRK